MDLREAVAQIIDPEAFGLPPTDVGKWGYLTDRDLARERADAAIALVRAETLKEAAEARPPIRYGGAFFDGYAAGVKDFEAAILSLISRAESPAGRQSQPGDPVPKAALGPAIQSPQPLVEPESPAGGER